MKISSNVIVLLLATISSGAAIVCNFEYGYLTTDVPHYTSVAKNLLAGFGLKTDIVYYEQQLFIGSIPADQTVFPPGYSLLIAALMALGMNSLDAVFAICLFSFLLVPWLMYYLLSQTGLHATLNVISAIVWLCFGIAWAFVVGGYSDSLFIAVELVGIVCLLKGFNVSSRDQTFWFLVCGIVAAVTIWIRYAGLFYLMSLGAYLFIDVVRLRSRRSLLNVLLVAVPGALASSALFFRNYLLIGSPSGGPDYYNPGGIVAVLKQAYWSLAEIFGFHETSVLAGIVQFVLLLAVAACLWECISRYLLSNTNALRMHQPESTLIGFTIVYAVITLSMLAYLALFRDVAFMNPRYLMPLIPLTIMSCTILLKHLHERLVRSNRTQWSVILVALLTCGFVFGQVNVFRTVYLAFRSDLRYETIDKALDHSVGTYSLREFLRSNTDRASPLLAVDGQLLGMILEKPAIGLARKKYINRVWTTEEVLSLIKAYGVSYVIFFPTLFDQNGEENRNRVFFTMMQEGDIPNWLIPVLEEDDVELYRVSIDN